MIVATALPLARANAWWIRVFDFSRLQITVITALTLVVFLVLFYRPGGWHSAFAVLLGAALAYQCRSEEHTSELQSRLHLVCRLLLEKKKKKSCVRLPQRHYRPQAASCHP